MRKKVSKTKLKGLIHYFCLFPPGSLFYVTSSVTQKPSSVEHLHVFISALMLYMIWNYQCNQSFSQTKCLIQFTQCSIEQSHRFCWVLSSSHHWWTVFLPIFVLSLKIRCILVCLPNSFSLFLIRKAVKSCCSWATEFSSNIKKNFC